MYFTLVNAHEVKNYAPSLIVPQYLRDKYKVGDRAWLMSFAGELELIQKLELEVLHEGLHK